MEWGRNAPSILFFAPEAEPTQTKRLRFCPGEEYTLADGLEQMSLTPYPTASAKANMQWARLIPPGRGRECDYAKRVICYFAVENSCEINNKTRKRVMTKGQIEAAITAAITQFEREMLGRGPKEARTFVVHDLVVVRLKGILSPGEQQLAREAGGIDLIKQMRTRLIESFQTELSTIVQQETGVRVLSMHADISTRTGERMFVFTLEEDMDTRW
jgi:uncharacterized protein YbcI